MRWLSEEQVSVIATRARALAEPGRVRLLERLSRGDLSVGQLAASLGMQQSTASKHLQVLYRAGLVERRRAASTVIYSIAATELITWCRYLAHRHLPADQSRAARGARMEFRRGTAGFRSAQHREV
jgi:DNA-binding transcriptional ArsR family regulator